MNFCVEMAQAKHVSEQKVFFSMNADKIRGKRIFEIIDCPFQTRFSQRLRYGWL